MVKEKSYANVILPLPVKGTFTYEIPENLIPDVTVGMRAIVQFGQKKVYTSIIQSIHSEAPSQFEPKEIISLPDKHPVILPVHLSFWEWISSYYLCTIGEVFKAALPTGLKPESETCFSLNETDLEKFDLNNNENLILVYLQSQKSTNITEISKATGIKNPLTYIHSLIKQNIIEVDERLSNTFKPKLESFISLGATYKSKGQLSDILDKLSKAPKQKSTLESFIFIKENKGNEVKKTTLLNDRNASLPALTSLLKKKDFDSILQAG